MRRHLYRRPTRRDLIFWGSVFILPRPLFSQALPLARGASNFDDSEVSRLLQSQAVAFEPGRRYRITRPLVIPSNRRLDGNGCTLEMLGSGPAISIARSSSVSVSNMSILGNGAGSDGDHGIFVDLRGGSFNNISLTKLRIAHFGDSGITVLGGGGASSGVHIGSCDIAQTGGHGIIIQDYVSDVTIVHNRVSNPGLRIADRPAITASRFGRNISILNNICSADARSIGSSCHGISLDRTSKFLCEGNSIAGFRLGFGIEVGGAGDGIVRNNKIDACGHGIAFSGFNEAYRCSDVLVSDNEITNALASGLHAFITNCDGSFLHQRLTLLSNNVSGAAAGGVENGIFLMDSEDVVIRGCGLRGFTKAAIYLVDCRRVDIQRISSVSEPHANGIASNLVVRWRAIRGQDRHGPALRSRAFVGSPLKIDVQN